MLALSDTRRNNVQDGYYASSTGLSRKKGGSGLASGLPVIRECNRFSQAYLRLLIGEIGGNSTKRPFRLPLDIATRLEKWI